MPRYDSILALFEATWVPGQTAEQLCERLTVEGIHYQVPEHIYPKLVEYRHLRSADRLRNARKFVASKTPA